MFKFQYLPALASTSLIYSGFKTLIKHSNGPNQNFLVLTQSCARRILSVNLSPALGVTWNINKTRLDSVMLLSDAFKAHKSKKKRVNFPLKVGCTID